MHFAAEPLALGRTGGMLRCQVPSPAFAHRSGATLILATWTDVLTDFPHIPTCGNATATGRNLLQSVAICRQMLQSVAILVVERCLKFMQSKASAALKHRRKRLLVVGTCQQLAITWLQQMIHSLFDEAVYFNATMPLDLHSESRESNRFQQHGEHHWASWYVLMG